MVRSRIDNEIHKAEDISEAIGVTSGISEVIGVTSGISEAKTFSGHSRRRPRFNGLLDEPVKKAIHKANGVFMKYHKADEDPTYKWGKRFCLLCLVLMVSAVATVIFGTYSLIIGTYWVSPWHLVAIGLTLFSACWGARTLFLTYCLISKIQAQYVRAKLTRLCLKTSDEPSEEECIAAIKRGRDWYKTDIVQDHGTAQRNMIIIFRIGYFCLPLILIVFLTRIVWGGLFETTIALGANHVEAIFLSFVATVVVAVWRRMMSSSLQQARREENEFDRFDELVRRVALEEGYKRHLTPEWIERASKK